MQDWVNLTQRQQMAKIGFSALWKLQCILVVFLELQKLSQMTQRSYELHFVHQQLATILENMLKIPKAHRSLHPSQQRSKYANLFEYLVAAMSSLLKQKHIGAKQLAQQQQQLITSALTEMIELTRKECLQKSLVLEMVLEYLISTLNAYWKVFQNASKEINYEYEHNAVKIEKEYISEIKRLQLENEQLKKDKEHRWRNMFMLIKDNRVYRKKNKKLMKSINYELEKGRMMTEQMIIQQFENEKIKAKLDYLQEETFNLEDYLEMTIKLVQLEKKVKKYPSRCKKMLKNDLINIEISQFKNLRDKINFIIKAVEETGEIIDEIYDEDFVFSNFHYNISTQTDNVTEDKGVNTTLVRLVNQETLTHNREHALLTHQDTVQLKVRGLKGERRDNIYRDSKNVMLISQSLSRFNQQKKEQSLRSGKFSRGNFENFSIYQAIKITIFQTRISYISTYNTEIFNGVELTKHIDQREVKEAKPESAKPIDVQVQTDPPIIQEPPLSNSVVNRSINKKQSKLNVTGPLIQENKRPLGLKLAKLPHFELCKEVTIIVDPTKFTKSKEQLKMVITQTNEKQNSNDTQRLVETERQGQVLEKQLSKDSPIASKVTIKKTSKNEQWKKAKMRQDQQKLEQAKKYQTTAAQTQNSYKLSIKEVEDFSKYSQTFVISKNNTIKAIQSINTEVSEAASSIVVKSPQKEKKVKQFNSSLKAINTKIQNSKESRNKSSIISPQKLRGMQTHRLSKLKEIGHKRTVTEGGQILEALPSQQPKLTKVSKNFKAKPLHRISQDIREIEHFGEEQRMEARNQKKDKTVPLPFILNKDGDLVFKDMDFSKGLQKILKNMDMRRQQILNNQHTMKSYLVSYFKCLYGRQLYQNFIGFLVNSEEQVNQELIICFNKLTNSKLPQPYLIDLFRTFIIMLNKCYLISESPTSDRIRLDLLKSMVTLYYEEEQTKKFVIKMNRYNIRNFSGWFICLEDELRVKAVYSELYHFLSEVLIQSEDSITYTFIEELAYFMPNEQLQFKNLIRSKTLLGKKIAIHRFALFCLRYRWQKMLAIQQTIESEYLKVLGPFRYQRSMTNVQNNMTILTEFKNLYKCMKNWLLMKEKYGTQVNRHLLMVCELVAMEYRMKVDFPISRELRFISLACEGVQKKLFHEQLKATLQQQTGHNYALY